MAIVKTKEKVIGKVDSVITNALGLSDYKVMIKSNGEVVVVTMDDYLIKVE